MIDEYMLAWLDGAADVRRDLQADTSQARDAYRRGYRDGMSAYLIAERSERERLVREAEDTEHVARLLSKES